MSLGSIIKLALAVWLAAEVVIFALVAKLIGAPEALLLGLLTSILGWTLLKRAGASAMTKLRAALDGRRVKEGNSRHVLDDTLASLGAIALLIPGFISDAVGLALTITPTRAWIARWVSTSPIGKTLRRDWQGQARGPTTIDLNPGDWERTGPSQKPTSKY